MMATEDMRPANGKLRPELAHHLHYGLHVIDRRLGQNAVPQVEDVARTSTGALQQLGHAHLQLRKRCEQRRRIEIPLDGGAIADVHPRLVDVDAPVDAHYIAARRVQLAKKSGSARAEMNHRNAGGANALDQSPRIRRREAYVIVGTERAHPTVE